MATQATICSGDVIDICGNITSNTNTLPAKLVTSDNGIADCVGVTNVTDNYIPFGNSDAVVGNISESAEVQWKHTNHSLQIGENANAGATLNSVVIGGVSGAPLTANANNVTIIGGSGNTATTNAPSSVLIGGSSNETDAWESFVVEGNNNAARSNRSGVVGGHHNEVRASTDNSAIVAGYNNTVAAGSGQSIIVGGLGNTTGDYSNSGIVAGGNNVVKAPTSVVAGGSSNVIDSVGYNGGPDENGGSSFVGAGVANHIASPFSSSSGVQNSNFGWSSHTLGRVLEATSETQIIVGRHNKPLPIGRRGTLASPHDPIFVVGVGDTVGTEKNGLEVHWSSLVSMTPCKLVGAQTSNANAISALNGMSAGYVPTYIHDGTLAMVVVSGVPTWFKYVESLGAWQFAF